MDEDTLDRLVASIWPVADADVAHLDLAASEADLLEGIMSTDAIERPPLVAMRARLVPRLISIAAAVAVLVGVLSYRSAQPGHPAYSAELIAVADAAPRLLVDAPGWSVSRADELSGSNGEMTFTDRTHELELHWAPTAASPSLAQDRGASADRTATVSVLGHPGTLFRYAGTTSYTTIWSDETHTLEARGDFETEAAYRTVLDHIKSVDSEAWLSAMPPSVIKPAATTAAVNEMLKDVPQPEGFHVTVPSATVHDRYQLGAAVTGQVACRWIGDWVAADAIGDHAAAARAADAMATSHHWAILQEMKRDGAFPRVLWEYADAMTAGGMVMGGKPLTVAESYKASLGCD